MAKWLYDGDCLITSCCNTVYDINKFERNGELIYLPCECPKCGARMTKECRKMNGRVDDIKISVKNSEIEYCFKADNVGEFEKRFDVLKDIIRQRLTN